MASQIHEMVSRGKRPPNLTVVLVGNDPPSQTYVRSKHRAATKVGMNGNIICKPDTISEVRIPVQYYLSIYPFIYTHTYICPITSMYKNLHLCHVTNLCHVTTEQSDYLLY